MGLYQFDTFTFDSARGELSEQDRGAIAVRHKVARLLEYLLANRERLVSKDELLEALWEHGEFRENSLTQSIRELRKALADNAQEPRFIKTFPQRGYQWICPLAQAASGEQAEVAQEVAQEEIKSGSRSWPPMPVLAAAMLLAALGLWRVLNLDTGARAQPVTTPKLLVMPFENITGDPSRDWLELGLSDMLASSLQRVGRVQVTPPAMSQGLLRAEGLEWPALPANLRALLRERGYDQALVASVREQDERQLLDFQLLFADGSTRRGSMRYASLTANSDAIAQQLLFLIHSQAAPELASEAAAPGADVVLASQAWARGLHAMQTSGAARADDYFQAAQLLAPDSPWVRACRGKTRLLLGDWRSAKQLLAEIDNLSGGDSALVAFVRYWQAELAYRAGDDERAETLLSEAIGLAQSEQNVRVLADAYRLRARIAGANYQWREHWALVSQAHELMPLEGDLRVEAEKLYYLGSLISQGPENGPQTDLRASREPLQTALNYYIQLGNRPMIAASQFALARNDRFDLDARRTALKEAITLYEDLRQPYELAEALIYAAFFELQLHNDVAAQSYVEMAEQVIEQLGDHRRKEELTFYREKMSQNVETPTL